MVLQNKHDMSKLPINFIPMRGGSMAEWLEFRTPEVPSVSLMINFEMTVIIIRDLKPCHTYMYTL